jgi:hypothetical protein
MKDAANDPIQDPIRDQLQSLLRHAITAIPAVGGYLAGKGLLTANEAAQLDAGMTQLLLALAAILPAMLARLVMGMIAKHAPLLRGIFGGWSGGTSIVAMTLTAAAVAVSLPSCVVGVDEGGNYSLRPDPYAIDAALKYAIRHEDSAKSGMKRTNRGGAEAAEVNAEK